MRENLENDPGGMKRCLGEPPYPELRSLASWSASESTRMNVSSTTTSASLCPSACPVAQGAIPGCDNANARRTSFTKGQG